ncbi:hypothetical protein [Kitasatospora sp. NPDC058478]|uniref:hypothetical protein n=1 Tax=unclassified Kitasatospora TaxID=2633591 RepID=UPI00366A3FE4
MTSKDHHDLTARLTALADGSAPPARFDADRSIAEGTARLRRRKRAAVGAVAAVTVAVVATTALLAPGSGTVTPTPPAGPTPSTSPSSTPTPTPTPTVSGIDPLTTEVHFGWLPDWVGGEQHIGYETGYHGIYAQARGAGKNAARIRLSQYPAGSEPPMTGVNVKLSKVDAEPVNGRPAYRVVADQPESYQPTLRWLTPEGRWAEVSVDGQTPGDVTDEVLHKVATGVRFGHWNVPLPVQFTGLPETFKATDVMLSRPDLDGVGAWDLWLMFQVEGKNVSVSMRPVGPRPVYTSTDGSPYTDPHPPLESVQNGVEISIGTGAGDPPSLEQLGGLPWMLAHTKALGPDAADWTTDVIVP